MAELLYRWVEPDGSITFSPTPPPPGVEFDQVGSAIGTTDKNASETIAAGPIEPQPAVSPSILATSEHDVGTPLARVNEARAASAAEQASQKPVLNYAPELNSGITRADPEPAAVEVAADPSDTDVQTVASTKKQQKCLDLSKRVLSLERRLRVKLDWADMDNTVVAMARYQRSFDQHCST